LRHDRPLVLAVAWHLHADLLAATIDARWLTSGDTILP